MDLLFDMSCRKEVVLLTVLELSDVSGKPRVKLELPGPLNIGHRVRLAFRLKRTNAGRTEVLEVNGDFRVIAAGLDTVLPEKRQLLVVESSTGIVPHWRAVKKVPDFKRVLPPAIAPRKLLA